MFGVSSKQFLNRLGIALPLSPSLVVVATPGQAEDAEKPAAPSRFDLVQDGYFFWAVHLRRGSAEHPVEHLVLFAELVVLEDEVAVAVDDAFLELAVDSGTTNPILDCGVRNLHSFVADLPDNLGSDGRVNGFTSWHVILRSWVHRL